jgi:hypothetical protein
LTRAELSKKQLEKLNQIQILSDSIDSLVSRGSLLDHTVFALCEALFVSDELSLSTSLLALTTINTIIINMLRNESILLNQTNKLLIGEAISSISQCLYRGINSDDEQNKVNVCSLIENSLIPYSNLLGTRAKTEETINLITISYRLTVQKINLSRIINDSYLLLMPLTTLEQKNKIESQFIEFPISANFKKIFIVAGFSIFSKFYSSSYHLASSPLTLQLLTNPCEFENCFINIGFNNNQEIHNRDEYVSFNCRLGNVSFLSHNCLNGALVNISCNGSYSGTLTYKCPLLVEKLLCGSENKDDDCFLEHASNTTIHCSCSIGKQHLNKTNARYLSENNSTIKPYVFTFFTMAKYSKSTFITTVSTKQNIRLYRKNPRAVLSLFFLMLFSVCGIIWAHRLDIKEADEVNNLFSLSRNLQQDKRRFLNKLLLVGCFEGCKVG